MANVSNGSQVLSERILAAGIVEGILLWGNKRYCDFLGRRRCNTLDAKWFSWFLGEWNIARTIKKGKRSEVAEYLNEEFGDILANDKNGFAIDCAAIALRERGLTARVGKGRVAGLPISLVSKVAFLFNPTKYPPLDRFGKKGLNRLPGTKKSGGSGYSTFSTYQEYYGEFNRHFRHFEPCIRNEINESWLQELAQKFDVAGDRISKKAFRRKVFDNILMNLGRA